MTLQPTRRATSQSRERISTLFWQLAPGNDYREPEDVVRHLLDILDVLQGRDSRPDTSATALTFLLRLEEDPYYASPEQNRGGEKDSRSLVYSIGVLLFERLTGFHPFVASLSPLQSRVTRDRASRIGKNNLCSIPRDLRAILERAMSPFAEDRYADVTSMRGPLELFLGRADTVLAPPLRPHREARPRGPSEPAAPSRRLAHGSQSHMPRPRRQSAPPPPPGSPERKIYEWVVRHPTRSETEATHIRPLPSLSRAETVDIPAPILRREATARPRTTANRQRILLAAALASAALVVTALAAMLILRGGSAGDGDTAATRNPAPASSAAPEADPEPIDVDVDVTPMPEVVVTVDPEPEPAPTPRPTFSAERTGDLLLAAAADCIPAHRLARGIEIGATIRIPESGIIDRVFLASVPRALAGCLEDAFRLDAGPTDNPQTLTYSLWLSDKGNRARLRGQDPRSNPSVSQRF